MPKASIQFPIQTSCSNCHSKFSFNKKDIAYDRCNRTWSDRYYQLSVKCPFCGESEDIEGDLDYFTKQEFKYPELTFWEKIGENF